MKKQDSFSTLVELAQSRAEKKPDFNTYIFLADGEENEEKLSNRELDERARSIGSQIQSLGGEGKPVLLLYPPGLDYIAGFFGCLYAGAIAVPSYPPRRNRPDQRLNAIIEDCGAKIVLTNEKIFESLENRYRHSPNLEALTWVATDLLSTDGELADYEMPALTANTLAFLQYTSGSTGTPKGVMLTHGNLMDNLAQIKQKFGHGDHSCGVIWLPPYHDMGLIGGILQALFLGVHVILMSPFAFLQRPLRWLQAVSHYKATTSGGPNFAYDMCVRSISPEERDTLDLSHWQVAFNGAEPIQASTMNRFTDYFAPAGFRKEAFYPCYGLAEATLIVSGGEAGKMPAEMIFDPDALGAKKVIPDPDGQPFVGCGFVTDGHTLLIVDPDTRHPCADDVVGEIWVQGASVAQGYWGNDEATQRDFHAQLADQQGGMFMRTGDLGFLYEGQLFITGRLKDLMIIRGRNYYPQDIEQVVSESHVALEKDATAAFSVLVDGEEQLVVVQELQRQHRRADTDEVMGAIRGAIAEMFQLQVHAIVLIQPMSIPKTSSGKIQRRECRHLFQQNDLRIIALSTRDETPEPTATDEEHFIVTSLQVVTDPTARHTLLSLFLQEQLGDLLAQKEVSADQQLGLDGQQWQLLTDRVQKTLGVKMPAKNGHPLRQTVNQLAQFIQEKLHD